MKKENSTLRKKLKQYSALAGSMLAVAGAAEAQVIYTDIPDTAFTAVNYFPGDLYAIDLNNDGTTDFNFAAWRSSSYVAFGLMMYPSAASNPNGVLGNVVSSNNHPQGLVSELSLGDNIDSGQNFFTYADLVFSTNQFFVPLLFSSSNANVIGQWQFGGTDHFAGLKFSVGADTYFGWVRADVAADASSITIKDYAYNATAGEGLFAGQGSPLGASSVSEPGNFNILGFEGIANIFVNDGKSGGTVVTVTNMLGQTLIKQGLNNRTTRIDLNQFGKGIYLVTLQRGEEVFSRKVSFR